MPDISFLIFQLAVLIFSVMVHEISHGLMAERLGDPTARLAGRLSVNPLRHLDPFGSVILPLIFFFIKSPVMLGWAKPVPYNPLGLTKDLRYGPLKVALAGPASNLILFGFFALIARLGIFSLPAPLIGLFGFIAFLNVFLAVFNLIPIPPLDGSKILTAFLPPQHALRLERFGFQGIIFILIFVFFFSGLISFIAERIFLLVAGLPVLEQILALFAFFSG